MTRSRMALLLLGSVLGLALALPAAASAHGGDATLVHACVNKSSGEVKIVGPDASCKNHETAVDWPAAATPPPAGGGAVLHARGNFSLVSGTTTFAMFVEEGTEDFVAVTMPRAGELASLFVHPTASPAAGATLTVTVRVNGVDTPLAVTHTSADGTGTVANAADVVAVNQGDRVAVRFTESGGVVPAAVYRASFELR